MLFTLLAPEYILGKPLGDRVVAECCKKRFKTVGINLTLTHVFYANMGGFVLTEQWPAFLSAQNIYRLRGIPCIKARISNIKTEELWDKSKQDILLKIVAVIQVFWMTLQIVVRVGKGLDISQLELAVAAFSVCSIITYIFLIPKPQSVQVPTPLIVHEKVLDDEIVTVVGDLIRPATISVR
jgi:hypothetical protein